MTDSPPTWIDTLSYHHHRKAMVAIRDEFFTDENILAVLLGGSLAHGYERPDSDIDLILIVSDAEYSRRRSMGELHQVSEHLTPYEGGYFDAKYQSVSFLKKVAEYGSEPARFAFCGVKVIFSRVPGLDDILFWISHFPAEGKLNRIIRFHAQLEAWHWFCHEAIRRSDQYLIMWSVSHLVLFGSRMLLAHNEIIYPYHKAMRHELAKAKDLPSGLFEAMDNLLARPSSDTVTGYYKCIKEFRTWEEAEKGSWVSCFVEDNELNWLDGHCPLEDM